MTMSNHARFLALPPADPIPTACEEFARLSKGGVLAFARLSEVEAERLLTLCRWPSGTRCARCNAEAVYRLSVRRVFKCCICDRQFSVTTGTYLSGRKMPIRTLIVAAFMFVASANGISSLGLARLTGCNQRSTYRLGRIWRQAIWQEQQSVYLYGAVEIDGAFVGGYREHVNVVKGNRSYRITRGRFHNRSVVVVARQREGRSVTFVGKKESDALEFLRSRISPLATIHADQAHAWDSLNQLYDLLRINHKIAFSLDGVCTNNAESFFSRLRRMAGGVHHRISGPYLHLYAAEMAWRADHVGHSIGQKLDDLLGIALCRPLPTESLRLRAAA